MRFSVLTVYPELFNILDYSIVGKALQNKKFEVQIVNIRDFSKDKHSKTDDAPFGGGAGMVMTPQPIVSAIRAVDGERKAKRVYLSPKGKTLNQDLVCELAKAEELLLLCGSFEGVDQRALDLEIDEEISIGDYVLTSGELPALVLINAVSRYIDGVLGSEHSTDEESFSDGLLEYPHYTRPASFESVEVPPVLLSGNHAEIATWRKEQSLKITRERRPDLLENQKNNKSNKAK
ncbi:MAG: tRNA (guanosine(37)-N1)-methyltransferase TrmD [Clostridia bacterium]|nr:tRNA (guanosine(37)-N1)-methyltransferase TrmD [Clostridia bacterium]